MAPSPPAHQPVGGGYLGAGFSIVKIVMTMMVRDEADIIEAVLEHHRRQGVDHILVTDNGSVDGTREALERFAQSGFVTVWDDPVHRKQQSETVTRMARLAATEYGADWVINADADEFFVAADEASTLRDELRRIDEAVQYVTVQVVNLTGAPAVDGTGLQRLIYRDRRSAQRLVSAGIPFHPTGDAIHRGHAEVSVSQGNHFVSAPNWGDPVPEPRIEVLHLPWRSWAQYERKVRNTGESYRANPDLEPSIRHVELGGDAQFSVAGSCTPGVRVSTKSLDSLSSSDYNDSETVTSARLYSLGEINSAIEEILRFQPPIQVNNRRNKQETILGDTFIPEGSSVHMIIAAANRDPKQFTNPDNFSVSRQPNRHLSFGLGIHICAGNTLARIEGKVAFSNLISQFKDFNLISKPKIANRIRFREIEELKIELSN